QAQHPSREMTVLMRGDRTTGARLAEIRRIIGEQDASIQLFDAAMLGRSLTESIGPVGLYVWMVSAFSVVALVIAATGLYGLIAYTMSLRAREMGIRLALGAEPGALVRTVTADAFRLVLFGGAVGLLLAVAVSKLMQALVIGAATTTMP